MKVNSAPLFVIFVIAMVFLASDSIGQVVVSNKNLNNDKELEYIQFMYYVDKSNFKPVYFVDYGALDSESSIQKGQKIVLNGDELKDNVSPVWALNKFYKAGWEYMGDVVYVSMPMMDNWHAFTLRRKKG